MCVAPQAISEDSAAAGASSAMITAMGKSGAFQPSPALLGVTSDEGASASSSMASEQSALLESLEGALSPGLFEDAPLGGGAPDGLEELLAAEDEERFAPAPRAGAGAAGPVLSGAERANLVNWMTSAAAQLGLGQDTLFTAVGCLDDLRLPPGAPHALMHSAACVWLAAKWSLGSRTPPASALVAALPACACGGCDGCAGHRGGGAAAAAAAAAAGARRQLLAAEAEVLRALNYGSAAFRRPTAESFLRASLLRLQARRKGAAGAHAGVLSLCSLLAEQSLLECQLRGLRASTVAAGCVAYAHALAGVPLRASELAAATGRGGAVAAADASRAADVLRAVHAAVAAAAAGGNPYACSLHWLRVDAAALMVPPISSAGDARVRLIAAGREALAPGAAWQWVLPDARA